MNFGVGERDDTEEIKTKNRGLDWNGWRQMER